MSQYRRWILLCCFFSACRRERPAELVEFRTTLSARTFLGTYQASLQVPASYVAEPRSAGAIRLVSPTLPAVIIGVDPYDNRAPCDRLFPVTTASQTPISRVDLPDGRISVCDENYAVVVVREIEAKRERFFCVADVRRASVDAMITICRSMTVRGPFLDDVSPAISDEAVIEDLAFDKRVHVKLQVPIGYVQEVRNPEASWRVPNSDRQWPSISVSVRPPDPAFPPAGESVEVHDDRTTVVRWIPAGSARVTCRATVEGSFESQVQQLKQVCASMTARL